MQKLDIEREVTHTEELLELLSSDISLRELSEAIIEYHPYDVAKILKHLTTEQRKNIYEALSANELAPIFEHVSDKETQKYFNEMPIKSSVRILEQMEIDESVDILKSIEDEQIRHSYLKLMDNDIASTIKQFLEYSEEEVGSIMSTGFIKLTDEMLAKDAMRLVLSEAKSGTYINTLYVANVEESLVGVLSLRDLIIAEKEVKITDIMSEKVISVLVDFSKESAATIFKDYDFESVPVVDNKNRIVGILSVDDIIDVIEEEATEDYAKFAGIIDGEIEYETGTILSSVRRRSPWLIILLFIGIIASVIIGRYEQTLEAVPILAMFLPMMLDMAGNVGTQSLAVTIRYLTDDEFLNKKVVLKHLLTELGIGILNGIIVSILAFGITIVLLNIVSPADTLFASEIIKTSIVISLSMLASIIVANVSGTIVPLIINFFKIDPAAASGPFITTINDIIALTVYFTLATTFLI